VLPNSLFGFPTAMVLDLNQGGEPVGVGGSIATLLAQAMFWRKPLDGPSRTLLAVPRTPTLTKGRQQALYSLMLERVSSNCVKSYL
jgi:hypothetical protein